MTQENMNNFIPAAKSRRTGDIKMIESNKKLIEAIKEYREKLEQMTQEERDKEEAKYQGLTLLGDSLED